MIALKVAQKCANDKRDNAFHKYGQLNIEIWQRQKRKKKKRKKERKKEEKRREDLNDNA
jgi:hypothetical protein